jgi:hypothetical protein
MQRIIVAILLLGLSMARPAVAQAPNVQQLLQGLTTGNQGQDQALRDAFERGYQRGRQDEARQQRSNQGGGSSSYRGNADEGDSDRSRAGRAPELPYGRQSNPNSR